MGFLGVYKAVYDYAPQGDTELAITEGDILYVLEKSGEDDWWKAKKKASGEDEDEPEGLIPNNYVEKAHPIHKARALYDYTRQTDEELSFTEDAQLEVFDTSDPDWILVGLDGEYGFAPANYIEVSDGRGEAAAAEPPAPSLPRRPPRAQEEEYEVPREPESPHAKSPAAAMAGILNQRRTAAASPETETPPQYTPDASEDEDGPTPALPARPSLQIRAPAPIAEPRSPPSGMVASPPYNRAAGRREDDDTPVLSQPGFHMYNINEMVSVMGKRKKMPTTLGINSATGIIMIAPEKARDGPEQTWTAEKMTHYSIEGKHVFLELVRPSKSVDFHAGAKDTAYEIVSVLGELAGAVRAEGLREVIQAGTGHSQKTGKMLYDFMAQGDDEVTVAVGDEIILLDDTSSDEWWKVRRVRNGKEGVVPSSYVEITGTVDTSRSMSAIDAVKAQVEQNRLEEERLAKESLKAAREEDTRGSEVGPGVRLPERGSSLMAGDSGNNHGQQRRGHAQNDSTSSRSKSKPDPKKVRTWTDRSKTFKVEAQFLGLRDGKINLHKTNGIKIAVPVDKMSVEDLEYVERITGQSLDEDKPLDRRSRSTASPSTSTPKGNVGASIEHPKKPEYDWFQFFLSCDVAVGLCEHYSQTFNRDSMDESVLPDVDSTVLRTLGIREGDIIKIMRFLDKKYGRVGGKRGVDTPDGESPGGLFSGPGGALRNNTGKQRPSPAVQTNNVVDPKAFSQETPKSAAPKSAVPDGVPTPLATAPIPEKKDVVRSGFDDDAWDVKPLKQQPAATTQPSQPAPATTTAPAPAPARPNLTGSMQELSLLSQPLQPVKAAPPPQPVLSRPPEQQGPPPVTPSIFQGIGNQQTGLPPPQQNTTPIQTALPQNIARQRPAPPPFQNQGGLIPPAPNRPLSAPQANQASGFPLPPLQAQSTGIQSSSGFQQIAPPGQSLEEMRLRQQYAAMNGPQNGMNPMPQPTGMNLMPQPTGFQYNGLLQPNQQPNGFQYPMQTGLQPMNNFGQQQISPLQQSPLQQPPFQQQLQQQQPQRTGFPGPFAPQAPQQFPQQTGVNAYLPPPLQPTPTGMQNPSFASTFTPPPVPPIPQQPVAAPLTPQKTGPAPPVRFGVNPDAKKLAPQPTGRRANLAQATPQNPFGF